MTDAVLEAIRAAIRRECGPEPVRCRACRDWFRRPAGLEPWAAAVRCERCG